MKTQYEVIIFYKYIFIENPGELMRSQKEIWNELNLKGRMIIASEGINGTLEGKKSNIKKFTKILKEDPRFSNLFIKTSPGNGQSFRKASIKVRGEIVATHLKDDINPTQITGKYLKASELHEWLESGKKFYIVDMRNDYEQLSGYFENSILSEFRQFYDLPKILPKIAHLKDATIVTVCTAGVRCEKASGFLVSNGFSDVYQLWGGIHTYMQEYPNQNFKGKLYVFDNRLIVGFNEGEKSEVVGRCFHCKTKSDNYVNCAYDFCHYHTIMCKNCLTDGIPYCSNDCRQKNNGRHSTAA